MKRALLPTMLVCLLIFGITGSAFADVCGLSAWKVPEKTEAQKIEVRTSAVMSASDFGPNSHVLTNELWPMQVGDRWTFTGSGNNAGGTLTIEAVGSEVIFGISCLKIAQTVSGLSDLTGTVYSWWAQDLSGNIHKIKSQNQYYTFEVINEADLPNIKYPAQLNVGDSWTYYLQGGMPDGTKSVSSLNGTFGIRSGFTVLHWGDGLGLDPYYTASEYYLPGIGLFGTQSERGKWVRSNFNVSGTGTTFLPYLKVGGSWQGFIYFTNSGSSSETISLQAYSTSGQAVGNSVSITVNSGEQTLFAIDSTTLGASLPSDGVLNFTVNGGSVTTYFGAFIHNSTDDMVTVTPVTDRGPMMIGEYIDNHASETFVVIRNAENSETSVGLSIVNAAGQVVGNNSVTLGAGATIVSDISSLIPGFAGVGWLNVFSTRTSVAGMLLYENPNRSTFSTFNMGGITSRSVELPYLLDYAGQWDSFAIVTNTGDLPQTVDLAAYDENGGHIGTLNLSLQPYYQSIINFDGSTFGRELPASFSAQVNTSSENIYVSAINVSKSSATFGDYMIIPPVTSYSNAVVIPHVNESSSVSTNIILKNKGGSELSPVITSFDTSGNELGVNRLVSIPANGFRKLTATEWSGGASSSGWLKAHSGSNLIGFVYYYNGTNNSISSLPVSAQTVTYVNQPPTISGLLEAYTVESGGTFTTQVTGTDPENGVVFYSFDAAPEGMDIGPNGEISWAAPLEDSTHSVVVRVADDEGAYTLFTFTITVSTVVNNPPVIEQLPDVTIFFGEQFTVTAVATDPEGDGITFALDMAPNGMFIDSSTGVITWTPNPFQIGTFPITVVAFDTNWRSSFIVFNITVEQPSTPEPTPTPTATPEPTPEAAEIFFGAPAEYSAQGSPQRLIVDKFDGNKYDIAVSLQGLDSIKIFRNNGTGGFDTSEILTAGDGVYDVNSGDLNGDGLPELVATNVFGEFVGGGQTMYVYSNDGSGNFGAPSIITLTNEPYTTAIADFTNDGTNDIMLSLTSWDLELYQVNGGVVLPTPTRISGGDKAREIFAGDFNNDGKMDMAVVYYDSTAVMIYSNNNGVFTSPQSKLVSWGPTALTGGDLNGDNAIDLVVNDLPTQRFFIIYNGGAGVFDDPIVVDTPVAFQDVQVADLDGDGVNEIIGVGGDSLYIYRPGATGLFELHKSIVVGGNLIDVKLADVDADGKPDAIVLSGLEQTVKVLLNETTRPASALRVPRVNMILERK